jgi:hypothetical protein
LFELCTALNEMYVRVVKSGQQQFAASVDYFGLRTTPQIDVSPPADSYNAISNYSDCFGFWMLFIYRVNGSVSHNQSCRRFRLRIRVQSGHNYQDTDCEFTFHNCDECRKHIGFRPDVFGPS